MRRFYAVVWKLWIFETLLYKKLSYTRSNKRGYFMIILCNAIFQSIVVHFSKTMEITVTFVFKENCLFKNQ